MDRRAFLKQTGALALAHMAQGPAAAARAPEFHTGNGPWQAAYDRALQILAANVQVLPRYAGPVLIEGADYAGVWQECGPHEGLVYRRFRPDVARHNHIVFFDLQREDGQLPANNKRTETGFGQIQMVVPIAATAWELAQATGDDELLHKTYAACSRWDDWLVRFRNTRGTGLVEGFCTFDTGQDNSPRWAGVPPQCPGKDAKRFTPGVGVPRLCPDLSATVYGGRVALAAMARAMGRTADADRWTEQAETLRRLILQRLYVPEDAAFYDLDTQDRFVKIRCDILSRMCGEHIPDQKLFDELWTRQLHNPKAFWAPFPLPSVALDDPLFVRPIPRNCWGGPSQALTALRAGRWFDHYGRSAEFAQMMDRWCEAIQRDMTFRQQLDPMNGDFTKEDLPSYSPACLVMLDYTWRLAGVCEGVDTLDWNVRPGHPAAQAATFRTPTDRGGGAEMVYTTRGATLRLDGKQVATVEGTARLVTDKAGRPQTLIGVSETRQTVTLTTADGRRRRFTVAPNQRVPCSGPAAPAHES